jgi:ABC-type polysaccharide/polyol phosphate transport system ATPase subunit
MPSLLAPDRLVADAASSGTAAADGTAASDRLAIAIDDVCVRYRVPLDPGLSLKEYVVRRFARQRRHVDHEALAHVSVTVAKGAALGIIGANGSGKTTLLRLIAKVLTPTSGRVRVWGRVGPLLDVIGGFHPELTGRENVFLNGTLLGLSRREIAARFEAIAGFAEIGEFIDAPMRTYSSGMVVRLGFAIASDVDPDILAIDEALGVGDDRFQRKCAARLDGFRERGTTLVIVSHDMTSIRRLCTTALWLDHGRARMLGPVDEVVNAYLAR